MGDYLVIVQKEYDKKEQEKKDLIAKTKQENITAQEKEALLAKIDELETALNPKPTKPYVSLPSRVYMHVINSAQKQKVGEISTILTEAGFSVPGIQVLASGPNTTELRYFRKREEEYALSAFNLIKDKVAIELKYVPGYESSSGIRDRHFEIWFSKDAFN